MATALLQHAGKVATGFTKTTAAAPRDGTVMKQNKGLADGTKHACHPTQSAAAKVRQDHLCPYNRLHGDHQ
jgi:hypothetical protein